MRSFQMIAAFLLAVVAVTFAVTPVGSPDQSLANLLVASAVDPAPLGPEQPPEIGNPILSLDEPIGEIYAAGTTWYDLQHNGTAGKMIAVDESGYVHLVWTNGLNSSYNPRHVYYNVWDPITHQMELPGGGQHSGAQIDGSTRSGFVTQAVSPEGFAFPAFHQVLGSGAAHSASAMDFLPRVGAFTTTEPAYLDGMQLIWPKIAIDGDSILHMVSTESSLNVLRTFYSRGVPLWDPDGFGVAIDWQVVGGVGEEFLMIDTSSFVTADIAASKTSNRVAIAWTKHRPSDLSPNNDVAYRLSEDGGMTWGPVINLTQFTAQDTHRAYLDVSLVFDEQDFLHIAFTTIFFDEINELAYQKSMIWHWDEQHNQFSALAEAWYLIPHGDAGVNMTTVGRPSLSVDPVSDFVYCSYQKYDTTYWTEFPWEFLSSDAWVTVSTDGGVHWSVGRNVTDTHPAVNPVPLGQSLSERDITLADRATYTAGTGYLHLEWELDLDAGTAAAGAPEGVATLNTIFYQRIPVNEIPLTPLMPWYSLHADELPPPTGRCCYGEDPHQPLCGVLTEEQCVSLSGIWDSTLTCSTPCPFEILCTCQSEPNTHCNLTGGPIPDADLQGVDFVIPVPIEYHVTDVNVCLDITHEYVGELSITLQSPAGTMVPLIMNSGYGENLTCTTFDDEADQDFWQGTPPYNDSFRPQYALSLMDGENALGDWVLHVTDTMYLYTGMLNWVCLSFNYDEILPVELSSFTATARTNGIEVAFRTASETNTDRFEILRGLSANGSFARIANLASEGSSSSGQDYSYLDENVTAGQTYWYYLVDVDRNGNRTEHRDLMRSVMLTDAPVPLEYSLSAYPNPFNPTTTIRFSLKEAGDVTLAVYNVSGQWMRDLTRRHYEPGHYAVRFDANELPSGIYFAKISAGGFVKTEKLVLMK